MIATRCAPTHTRPHYTLAAITVSATLLVAASAGHAGIVGPSSDMIQPGFEYSTSPDAPLNPILNLPGEGTAVQRYKLFSLTGAPGAVGEASIIQDFHGDGTLDLLSASGVATRYSGAFEGVLSTRKRGGNGGTRATMDSSVLQLTFSVAALSGLSVQLRESPTLTSSGVTTIDNLGDGTFRVESFFDIFVELSFDGGQNWNPAQSPLHLDLVPSPGVATAFFGAFGLTLARRRR